MSKEGKNLAIGIIIGAAAGFVTGIMLNSGKAGQTTDSIKSKISDLAADAQERIKALRAMAQRQEQKTAAKAEKPESTPES